MRWICAFPCRLLVARCPRSVRRKIRCEEPDIYHCFGIESSDPILTQRSELLQVLILHEAQRWGENRPFKCKGYFRLLVRIDRNAKDLPRDFHSRESFGEVVLGMQISKFGLKDARNDHGHLKSESTFFPLPTPYPSSRSIGSLSLNPRAKSELPPQPPSS